MNKTSYDYDAKCAELVALCLGRYIDMCVDSENVYPLNEGDAQYWNAMCVCLIDSVTMRASEDGIELPSFKQ